MKANRTKELHDGINGKGNPIHLVVTVNADGSWHHVERFENKAEALCWMGWA